MSDFEKPTPPEGVNWPVKLEELPLFLKPGYFAALLDCSVRTLERDRTNGGIPFVKHGRRILYPRDVAFAELRKRMYTSTAEAKRAAREDYDDINK